MKETATAMGIAVLIPIIIGIFFYSAFADPNEPVEPNKPRQIVMPQGNKLPPPPIRYKCPRHGPILDSFLILEDESGKSIYCKKCAIKFVVDVFDLNLPKLKIVEDP